jgi:hypothetical protein
MERGHVFVEIHHEEIQTAGARLDCIFVMLYHIVEMSGRFRSQRSNLLVASSVSREE